MAPSSSIPSATRFAASGLALTLFTLVGCEMGLRQIDESTNEKLRSSAEALGGNAIAPVVDGSRYTPGSYFPDWPENADQPPTINPRADELVFKAVDKAANDAQSIAERFEQLMAGSPDARLLTFDESISYAIEHSEEYLLAQESYLITAIRLLIEEHRWTPLPTNVSSAQVIADGNDGRFASTLNLLNETSITQQLPFGGDVSAAFVVDATQQLDNAIGDDQQSADIVLAATFPLQRGFGDVALEPLIQSRRNLVYAARNFETFRREFYFQLATNYLGLVLQLQQIANAERQVERSQDVEDRTKALVSAGRTEPFQADLAIQNTLFALDRLSSLQESYRLQLDRFKVRIGLPEEAIVRIDPVLFVFPVPVTDLRNSITLAFRYRLDLQNLADAADDFARRVDVARNALLGDLTLSVVNTLPTDPNRNQAGVQFSPGDDFLAAALTYSAPLDRVREDLQLRQAQILLEQSKRQLQQSRDEAAVEVRAAVRRLDRAQFSLAVQERNVAAANNRQTAIDAAPDRATARDRTEAVDALRRAQDQLASAKREIQEAILGAQLATGQLRVAPDGRMIPPPGMNVVEEQGSNLIDRSK